MSTTFNRFACELSLDRFKQRYDAGKIGAYVGDRGPGDHSTQWSARRRTAEGMQHAVRKKFADNDDGRGDSTNHMWPTAAELEEVAEKLEAYARKLAGVNNPNNLPDVRFGHSYSQQSRASSAATQSALQMPIERLRERVEKQRLLLAKWEARVTAATVKQKRTAAQKRVSNISAKLRAAEAILNEREQSA